MPNQYWVASVVDSFKSQISFAKEPYKIDDILQKRPIILRSLLIVATPEASACLSVCVYVCVCVSILQLCLANVSLSRHVLHLDLSERRAVMQNLQIPMHLNQYF